METFQEFVFGVDTQGFKYMQKIRKLKSLLVAQIVLEKNLIDDHRKTCILIAFKHL